VVNFHHFPNFKKECLIPMSRMFKGLGEKPFLDRGEWSGDFLIAWNRVRGGDG